MGVRIISDTSCDLPPELEAEILASGTQLVPFLYHFGQEACTDRSMPMREFLERAQREWPTTAAPSVGTFAEAFRRIVEAGDQALCITITGKHSATFHTALLAAQQFEPGQVEVVDSQSISLVQGLLVLAAVRAARAGAAMHEIIAQLEDLKRRIGFYFALDTLDYLVKGGRASRLVGLLANLLRLRPILTLREGELTLLERPRQRSAAKARLLALAQACLPAEIIGVMHADCPDEAAQLAAEMAQMSNIPLEQIPIAETGAALATHSGPGALGVVVIARA